MSLSCKKLAFIGRYGIVLTAFTLYPSMPTLLAQASPVTVAPSPLFLSDPRLIAPISIQAWGVPLKEFFANCSSKELKLNASANCAELKIQANLKSRPLKEMMSAVSELFQGEWVELPDKKGWYFTQSSRTVQKREKWWKLYEAERDNAILKAKRFMLEEHGNPFKGSPANEEQSSYDAVAEGKEQHELFRKLPLALVEKMADRINLDHYLNSNCYSNFDDEGALPLLLGDLPPFFTEYVKRKLAPSVAISDQLNRIGFDKLGIELQFRGGSLDLSALPPSGTSPWMLASTSFISNDPFNVLIGPYHEGLPQCYKQFPQFLTPSIQVLLKYENERIWKNTLPKLNRFFSNNGRIRPVRWQKLRWLSEKGDIEFLSDYHSTSGYPLKDYEMKARLERTVDVELNEVAELHDVSWKKRPDNLYLVKNNRWYRDDYIEVPDSFLRTLMATKLPYFQSEYPINPAKRGAPQKPEAKSDPKTEPKPLSEADRMKLSMDRAAEIASRLKPLQIATGLKFYFPDEKAILSETVRKKAKEKIVHEEWLVESMQRQREEFAAQNSQQLAVSRNAEGLFTKDVSYIMWRYRTVLFYASLSKELRSKLLGEGLPFEELSANQRDQAIWILPRIEIMQRQGDDSPKILSLKPARGFNTADLGKLFLKETISGN